MFTDQLAVIERAVACGIDAVHVTAYASMDVATGPTDSYAPHRVGDLPEYARAVRAAVDVPVITFGRLEPAEAERVLADGTADFVAMGRKLLADPDLPNKLLDGNEARGPAVPLPVPVHRQHLRERVARVRGERGHRPRGRRRTAGTGARAARAR